MGGVYFFPGLGVGYMSSNTSGVYSCSSWTSLTYARVGSTEYGLAAVDAERTREVSRFSVHPSVTRTSATLWLPVATAVEAFDPLGRRVLRLEAQAGDVTLDVSAWMPGLYLVRAGGETRRLVVR